MPGITQGLLPEHPRTISEKSIFEFCDFHFHPFLGPEFGQNLSKIAFLGLSRGLIYTKIPQKCPKLPKIGSLTILEQYQKNRFFEFCDFHFHHVSGPKFRQKWPKKAIKWP